MVSSGSVPASRDYEHADQDQSNSVTEDDLALFSAVWLLIPIALGLWALVLWGIVTVILRT
jgi:hypothetical protein